ncbi:hypothetical protein T03_12159 [Trichinella britovi]|uniref:Uncharacterized protein n=1 Tax=Trichinella britovi TaxID=45882 RepID=A0A0V1BKV3_TRIBR|nr:hypothetical protein T03_12159 [Trichinella britovi]
MYRLAEVEVAALYPRIREVTPNCSNASNFRVLMLTLRVSSQFHLILRLISRICLCQILFAFLVTSHMLVKAILIQRENQQVTNCSQLQLSSLTKE